MSTLTRGRQQEASEKYRIGNYGTLADAARTSGLSRWMAKRAAEAGDLRTTTVGGRKLFHIGDAKAIADRLGG